eukprot:255357_1
MSITYSYFSAVFTILLFFVALSFVVHASKSFFFADGKSKKFKRDCVSVALCIIALSFMCTCMFICIFIAFGPFMDPQYVFPIQYTGYVVFNVGLGFVLTLFVHSLHYSFAKSSYRYHPAIIWSLGVFQWLFMVCLISFDSYAFWVDFTVYHYRFWFYYPIMYLLHFVLLSLFNRNVILVAKSSFAHSENHSLEQNKRVQKLLNLVVRQTVLIWYVTITGSFVLTLSLCISLGYTFGLTPEAMNGMFWIFQYMDCVSMAVCVYLKMGFSTSIYYKACHYPHACCLSMGVKCARKIWAVSQDLDQITKSVDLSTKERARVASATDGDTINNTVSSSATPND